MPISHIMAFLFAGILGICMVAGLIWAAWKDEKGGSYGKD